MKSEEIQFNCEHDRAIVDNPVVLSWFRQQSIAWANVDNGPCRYVTPLDHSESIR